MVSCGIRREPLHVVDGDGDHVDRPGFEFRHGDIGQQDPQEDLLDRRGLAPEGRVCFEFEILVGLVGNEVVRSGTDRRREVERVIACSVSGATLSRMCFGRMPRPVKSASVGRKAESGG